jgi:hypothetical protein
MEPLNGYILEFKSPDPAEFFRVSSNSSLKFGHFPEFFRGFRSLNLEGE